MDPDCYLVHGEAYKELREQLTELLMQKAGTSEFEELNKVCALKRYQNITACHQYINSVHQRVKCATSHRSSFQ